MPTTILDDETFDQARHRRFMEEANVDERIQQNEIIRMARELAQTHGVRMCDEDGDTHGEELYCVGVEDIAEIIKQVAAHEREACAKLCEEGTALTAFQSKDCYSYARNRAAAIRARGN